MRKANRHFIEKLCNELSYAEKIDAESLRFLGRRRHDSCHKTVDFGMAGHVPGRGGLDDRYTRRLAAGYRPSAWNEYRCWTKRAPWRAAAMTRAH
jgi:hypothetical protein